MNRPLTPKNAQRFWTYLVQNVHHHLPPSLYFEPATNPDLVEFCRHFAEREFEQYFAADVVRACRRVFCESVSIYLTPKGAIRFLADWRRVFGAAEAGREKQ